MAILHFYCGCLVWRSRKEISESHYLSSYETQEHVDHLDFVPESSSDKHKLTVNTGYVEESTQSSSHSSNSKLHHSYYYNYNGNNNNNNNNANPLCKPSKIVTYLEKAKSSNISESHDDVKVVRNPFTVNKHKVNFTSEQNWNSSNTQSTDTAQSINLCSKNDKDKKSATVNTDSMSKTKYADAHSLNMKEQTAFSSLTLSPVTTSVTASTSISTSTSFSTAQEDLETSVPSILIRRRAPNWRTPEMNAALSQYQQSFDQDNVEHNEETSTPKSISKYSKCKNEGNNSDGGINSINNNGILITDAKSITTNAQRPTMIVKNCKITPKKNNYLTNILQRSSSSSSDDDKEDDSDLTNDDATVASVQEFDLTNTPEQKSITEKCNNVNIADKNHKATSNVKLSPLCNKSNTMKDVHIAVSNSCNGDEPLSRPLCSRRVSFVDEEHDECATSIPRAATCVKRNSPNGVKTNTELVDSVQSILDSKVNLFYNDNITNEMSSIVECDNINTIND